MNVLRKILSEPHLPPCSDSERLERMEAMLCRLLAAQEKMQWAKQADYAKKYGVCRQTVRKYTSYLRRIGAVKGAGRMALYNMAVSPSGEQATQ